jgi:hypothetical protein
MAGKPDMQVRRGKEAATIVEIMADKGGEE